MCLFWLFTTVLFCLCSTGITGALATMAYSIFTFRRRGNMSTSVFLMHLRVRAQSMIVGSMAIGVAVTLIKDYIEKGKKEKTTSK